MITGSFRTVTGYDPGHSSKQAKSALDTGCDRNLTNSDTEFGSYVYLGYGLNVYTHLLHRTEAQVMTNLFLFIILRVVVRYPKFGPLQRPEFFGKHGGPAVHSQLAPLFLSLFH